MSEPEPGRNIEAEHGVNGVSSPETHFSQDVIFCQVILKLHSKGRAKIIHSAESYIFKFTYLF